ncbi:hypothetical protein [Pseudomonas viridiflava]|uniref:hypothetical protein n=1 Tax=Pseudomonas viridiflava TaxID=33069 RepID=UPI0019685925|nr:hypothetical protein [Pseudomonas viridiflava]
MGPACAAIFLVHHYVPENRALRRWLTHEVMPAPQTWEQPWWRKVLRMDRT